MSEPFWKAFWWYITHSKGEIVERYESLLQGHAALLKVIEADKQTVADLQAKLEESKPLGHLCNEIVRLQSELQRLRTENAALKRPVTDEEAKEIYLGSHDGWRYAQSAVNELLASRSQEAQCRHLRKDTHPATRDIWICLDCGVNQDGSQEAQKGAAE